MIYPVVSLGGKRWVQITGHAHWLRRACGYSAPGMKPWTARQQAAMTQGNSSPLTCAHLVSLLSKILVSHLRPCDVFRCHVMEGFQKSIAQQRFGIVG